MENVINIQCIIWDLDGTIIDSENMYIEIAEKIITDYGKELTDDLKEKIIGSRPLDTWKKISSKLNIDEKPECLLERSIKLKEKEWKKTPLMPGVIRLLKYFKNNNIPMALATNGEKKSISEKLSEEKSFIRNYFYYTASGNDVKNGKPDPEIFLFTAKAMNISPQKCLVIEDSPAGVQAAYEAGMNVIAVPSNLNSCLSLKIAPNCTSVDILKSLLDFNPLKYNLPEFKDKINGIIPLEPLLLIKGTVIKGFGRGSKELGIKTANLDNTSLKVSLSPSLSGIFTGWASVGNSSNVYKMVMSIGWNPFYKNTQRTVEPWILHEFEKDFYNEEIRLVTCGYIRPECNFQSLEELKEKIRHDEFISEKALDDKEFFKYKFHQFLSV